jgi:hypothetical protein
MSRKAAAVIDLPTADAASTAGTSAIDVLRSVEYRDIAALIPYARNARLHDDAHIAQIAASIREWGWTMPVLIDEIDGILAGHGRVLAAHKLGIVKVPVIVARGWSEPKKRAYILADNKLALNAKWDVELLAAELSDLGLGAAELAGFTAQEVNELLEAPDAKPEVPKNPEAEELLNLAWEDWRRSCREELHALEALHRVAVGMSPAALRIHFLRTLYYGELIPQYATLSHQPQRIHVAGDSYALVDALEDKISIERVRWFLHEEPNWSRFVTATLPMAGARQPADFPVSLAKSLIDEFTPERGRVLDPCHGWGGRALGFLLSRAAHYTGFDPSPETFAGVRSIIEDLRHYVPDKTAETHNMPFEDASLDENSFDFALTSPPYFDVEKYTGPEQSRLRYPKYDTWLRDFYHALIDKTARALKRGAYFALIVGNQRYPLERDAIARGHSAGLRYVATRTTEMRNNFCETDPDDGEVCVLFEKTT